MQSILVVSNVESPQVVWYILFGTVFVYDFIAPVSKKDGLH